LYSFGFGFSTQASGKSLLYFFMKYPDVKESHPLIWNSLPKILSFPPGKKSESLIKSS
jgi:hypothetical protein